MYKSKSYRRKREQFLRQVQDLRIEMREETEFRKVEAIKKKLIRLLQSWPEEKIFENSIAGYI